MKRRQFLKTTAIAAAGLTCGADFRASEETTSQVIDIHQHVSFRKRENEAFLEHQKVMGIRRTNLLPAGTPMNRPSTRLGKGNGLAADVTGTQEAADFVKKHPESYAFFCNEVPDSKDAAERIEHWLERGAIGIGESKFHLEIDSPPMLRLYAIARAWKVPILMHFQHGTYNMGFERLPKILEKFPTVNFIGHAQTWWGNISAGHDQTVMYPKGPVTPGGMTDVLLRDYPNMFGDLSAGSGLNAMRRDEDHAAAFLDRHHLKLFYGSDCNDEEGQGNKCSGSRQLSTVRKLVPDRKKQHAILFGNANRVIFGNHG